MPASPRRPRSRRRSPARGSVAGTSSDARRSSRASGSGGRSMAARSSASCAGSARPSTSPASASRSMTGYAQAVQHTFVDLYRKGHVYRDHYMVNWDPGLGSAISDLEVEDREVTDALVEIAYPLADGSGELIVATVRPETMLGDTAVAVHPDDERYRHLVGTTCILPLGRARTADRRRRVRQARVRDRLPEDHPGPRPQRLRARAAPRPAGDQRDRGGRAHPAGDGGALRRAERRRSARRAFMADLEPMRACCAAASPYTHTVPFSHRSGRRVEPLISLQWFCDMKRSPQPAIAAVEDGTGDLHPVALGRRVRALDAGDPPVVPVAPALVGTPAAGVVPRRGDLRRRRPRRTARAGSATPTCSTPGSRPGCGRSRPSGGRSRPQSSSASTRPTCSPRPATSSSSGSPAWSCSESSTWARPPFADVYIHSVIQAADGRRMSKSLGTGVDPLELIDEHGADALRFGLLLMSSQQDVRFSAEKIRQGRQLVTKIWNATRLVDRPRRAAGADDAARARTVADRWMASRVTEAIELAADLIARYEFSRLADVIYHLVFDEFCDWYLELLKRDEATARGRRRPPRADPGARASGHALRHRGVLGTAAGADGAHARARPAAPTGCARRRGRGASWRTFRMPSPSVRAWRSRHGMSPKTELTVAFDGLALGEFAPAFAGVANVDTRRGRPTTRQALAVGAGQLRIVAPVGQVDAAAERARLVAELRSRRARARAGPKPCSATTASFPRPRGVGRAEREKVRRFVAERQVLAGQIGALGT